MMDASRSDSHLTDRLTLQSLGEKQQDYQRTSSFGGWGRGPLHLPLHTMDSKTQKKFDLEMENAVSVVDKFFNPKVLKDSSIPKELLLEAHGLVFLTIYKVGFLLSGKAGKGFVIARTATGWSAPSFLGSGGIGFGMMAGGEIVHYMVILGSRSAVKTFTRNGQVQLGSELDLAVGPVGRAASASVNVGRGGVAPNYSYSHCVGLYGGIGLASAVIATRKSFNSRCYGDNVLVRDILSGSVRCDAAVKLWQRLDEAVGVSRPYLTSQSSIGPHEVGTAARGIPCHSCGHRNLADARECGKCGDLVIYTVGDHSGRRKPGKLVMSNSDIS